MLGPGTINEIPLSWLNMSIDSYKINFKNYTCDQPNDQTCLKDDSTYDNDPNGL